MMTFKLILHIMGFNKRQPGTVIEPMSAEEADKYWAMVDRQSKETGGW